jgi:hypothetical protein
MARTKITHITRNKAGLHADSSDALARAIAALLSAGYVCSDIEDDPEEPLHVAMVHYNRPQDIRILQQLVKN